MRKDIDNDVRLFFPNKTRLLLFGGNCLLAKRLYEIIKRDLFVRRIDYSENNSVTKIKSLLEYQDGDTLIFTSELLLFLSDEEYLNFTETLVDIKTNTNTKLVFISITDPLHMEKQGDSYLLKNMRCDETYVSRVDRITDTLNDTDLIYEVPSYYTYVESNLQINPVTFEGNLITPEKHAKASYFFFSDDIISDVVKKINDVGWTTPYWDSPDKMTPSEFMLKLNTPDSEYSKVVNQTKCSLTILYRKDSYDMSNGGTVANFRVNLGKSLCKKIPFSIREKLDMIIPVPETGKYYAQGLASELNKNYVEAIYKKVEVGRSFDVSDVSKRNKIIKSKLGLHKNMVKGKTIGIVDEAIFTGSTLKIVSDMLREAKAREVYFFIPSPTCKSRCKYNMQPDRELLLQKINEKDLISYFNVDGIFFQDSEAYDSSISKTNYTCSECFHKEQL